MYAWHSQSDKMSRIIHKEKNIVNKKKCGKEKVKRGFKAAKKQ